MLNKNKPDQNIKGEISGFDDPLTCAIEDRLARSHIAENIFEVIKNTPNNWSVRVGVYGHWGMGKTTIINFVQRLAEKEGFPFIRFNPWACQNNNQMWISLGEAILDGIPHESLTTSNNKKWKKLFNRKKAKLIFSKVSELDHPNIKLASVGFSILSDFLRVDGDFIRNLKEGLGDKRLIICIDDIDRTDPKIIPHLLLSLREIMDVPGFSFIVAADRDKVAESIAVDHSSWGTGHEFLEKIIDFPYFLPQPTMGQAKSLFASYVNELSMRIDMDAADTVLKYLPKNPRKIKAVVRNIYALEKQIARHDEDDLDWKAIIIDSIIKVYSPHFRERIMALMQDYTSIEIPLIISDKTRAKEIYEKIGRILEEINDTDKSEKATLSSLFKALVKDTDSFSSERILYQMNLLSNPHQITWKEFRELLLQYKKSGINSAASWVGNQAEIHKSSKESVMDELLDTLIKYYNQLLETAADTPLLAQHTKIISQAMLVLSLTAEAFENGLSSVKNEYNITVYAIRFLEVVLRWQHFNSNAKDKVLRKKERKVVKVLTRSPFKESIALYEYLISLRGYKHEVDEFVKEPKRLLEEQLAIQAIEKFKQPKWIKSIRPRGANEAIKNIIAAPSSAFFNAKNIKKFKGISDSENEGIAENLRDYLEFLIYCAAQGTAYLNANEVAQVFKINGFAGYLWDVMVSKQLQFRMLMNVREMREKLIIFGVDSKELKEPSWLNPNK